MPQPDLSVDGAPCWINFASSDPARSRSFYENLFGWTSEDTGDEYGGYINFQKDGALVAGGARSDGESGPDAWYVYLTTDDAKALADAAVANGGQVLVPPVDVGELGTMVVVTDPGGAVIGAWQPGLHRGFGVIAEPDTPGWFELLTRDYDASVAFYREVFGWDTHEAPDTPGFRYTTLGTGDAQRAGIMDASGFLPEGTPGQWSVYFRVGDVDATLAKTVELGGAVVRPGEDTPYGRLAEASDATGAHFKLVG